MRSTANTKSICRKAMKAKMSSNSNAGQNAKKTRKLAKTLKVAKMLKLAKTRKPPKLVPQTPRILAHKAHFLLPQFDPSTRGCELRNLDSALMRAVSIVLPSRKNVRAYR